MITIGPCLDIFPCPQIRFVLICHSSIGSQSCFIHSERVPMLKPYLNDIKKWFNVSLEASSRNQPLSNTGLYLHRPGVYHRRFQRKKKVVVNMVKGLIDFYVLHFCVRFTCPVLSLESSCSVSSWTYWYEDIMWIQSWFYLLLWHFKLFHFEIVLCFLVELTQMSTWKSLIFAIVFD